MEKQFTTVVTATYCQYYWYLCGQIKIKIKSKKIMWETNPARLMEMLNVMKK